ncbi:ATP-grasp domain-containing protein (plasmid) [Burkholderia sp. FERM BP-3421]|jgi:biotin carboxylase|uniref:ATP-grasp domain-containing protein n=1 Tax=Burkholderia sp. FERM BP-3421 TaxID=1494466 RepID=UPI00235DFD62|nr:ATP-grasp domain-containing protein [Burkholderia sp. FERM BP-3421]WDD90664.1 ATP-grasp domain-containing protein [Burkholderia sp. FERM BP-3421]
MTQAVLLLMHQGNSFTQEVRAFVAARGLALVAVSSRPGDPEVFRKNETLLDDYEVADGFDLTQADVEAGVRALQARGVEIVAALATFEGYRVFMAGINAALGAPDAPVDALALTLDKHRCRSALREAGLSEVRGMLVPAGDARWRGALDPASRWFVKPVRGAASFACFILEDADALDDLVAMQQQMVSDRKLSAIFMGKYDFVVEEYVDGPEFSYEIIAAETPRVVCIHEKARVERQARTTLESMSITPPTSLPEATLREGADFVCACLAQLGLRQGAFHVEMKYWQARRRWEIIEVNPRMGGSLIHASTERATGVSLLSLWLRTLLARTPEARAALDAEVDSISQLHDLSLGSARRGTVFVSKYGARGRTIEAIRYAAADREPAVLKLHAKAGDTLDDSDRAICVMDALWEVERATLPDAVAAIEAESEQCFHIAYR